MMGCPARLGQTDTTGFGQTVTIPGTSFAIDPIVLAIGGGLLLLVLKSSEGRSYTKSKVASFRGRWRKRKKKRVERSESSDLAKMHADFAARRRRMGLEKAK